MNAVERLRAALAAQGLTTALLSHPETLAHLAAFDPSVEEWPVANPFVTWPALLLLAPGGDRLLIADFHAPHAAGSPFPVETYRSYDYQEAPDPRGELIAALHDLVEGAGRLAVEADTLPMVVADAVRAEGIELVDVDDLVVSARRIKLPDEIEAIRRASHLADVVQQAVKDRAEPGVSEAEVAADAQLAMAREAGRRVPAILTVTTGPETATGGFEATDRVIAPGDLVLCDTSPWIGGVWSDTANAVCAGPPDAVTRQRFDAVRAALHAGIELCRPGAVARDVDRALRERLAEHGPTYAHHSGHGIGAAWSEEPRITPYCEMRLEAGMVLALEPAIYVPGWGGIRLEHVFVVRDGGNEILTEFEHTL
jgi:Xaa-Pro aminopeptidase